MSESIKPVSASAGKEPTAPGEKPAAQKAKPKPPPEPEAEKPPGEWEDAPEAKRVAHPKLAALLARMPEVFRPRHLTQAIRVFAEEEGLDGEATAAIDPHKFLKEHGLPNPLKGYRVQGFLGGKAQGVDTFDAVDEADATAQYRAKHAEKDAQKYHYKVFLEDY